MSLTNRQVGEFLETQDDDTVLDIIAEALTADMLEAFYNMAREHGAEYRTSCTLFAGAILDKVAESVSRDEDAVAMFSTEPEDGCDGVARDDNRERAAACGEVLSRGYAA